MSKRDSEYTPSTGPFDPAKLSPSRMNALAMCGVAFAFKYLKKLPEEKSGSAALFGNVCHEALEDWAPNRNADLLTLMRAAWLTSTEGTIVKDFIVQYQALSVEAIRFEHHIRESWAAAGKESKAPRRTKDWKESDIALKINSLLDRWMPKLNADSPWRFKERDQLPALYDESLVLAKRYEARWRHLPPALYTEFAFDLQWRGFRLNGYIDAVETLLHPETGELQAIGIIDYKSYGQVPAPQKDWRQFVMYDIAIRDLIERGQIVLPASIGLNHNEIPLYVGADYLRWRDTWEKPDGKPFPSRTFWEMSEKDWDRLEREATAYKALCEAKAFLPANKSVNPDFCPYPSMCCLTTTAGAGGAAKSVEVEL